MRTSNRSIISCLSICATFALFAGCSVSKVTERAVADSETAVMQAQQAIGSSESGAMELQRARDHLEKAKQAAADGEDELAVRNAQQASLDARLATEKSQTAVARKAADDLSTSIQTLRQETQRSIDMPR